MSELHRAVTWVDLPWAKQLLDAGADPNAVDASGKTPLVATLSLPRDLPAVEAAILAVVKELLNHGADPNALSTPPGGGSSSSPIYTAVITGRFPALRELLARGADPNVGLVGGPGRVTMSALAAAMDNGYRSRYEAVTELIAAGADPDEATQFFNRPLLREAVEAGKAKAVEPWRKRGALLKARKARKDARYAAHEAANPAPGGRRKTRRRSTRRKTSRK